ncbi:pyridoxal-phosphate dependent enzyme [Puniceibacterium sp. IMCC21224]|uniref:pyridoxal-phosphate dependent enzyme n=1 Tax=Puniceibacterium sp. IMCC21224 TaxID=1618204 RepID=UPI00065D6509|nr:pyridoxal-phosphate dependent enzyme [Puniceibacterium sp. IMCC21224]KMK66176.1 threonine dehydratase [Puniceibacterium sp. IMCC21224]
MTQIKLTSNPCRLTGAYFALPDDIPLPAEDGAPVRALLDRCPVAAITPLVSLPDLAARAQVASVWAKDERARMGLGSFKALGAAFVIAHEAMAVAPDTPGTALAGRTYVTASAGNHGLSVAAGAQVFGARAVVYLSDTVPDSFALRLRDKGAEVVRAGQTYEASMDAAAHAAEEKGWTLLSDSSWPGYTELPWRLMQGYLALMDEVVTAMDPPPTHVFVQAGVGGLAASVAARTRSAWGDAPKVIVVEPDAADCVAASLAAQEFRAAFGPVSNMGRLDCKEASMIALAGLARDADAVLTVTDAQVAAVLPDLAALGLGTTPSGAAGLAALLHCAPLCDALDLTTASRVLTFVTEEPPE